PSMRLLSIHRRLIATSALALLGLGWSGVASGQYATRAPAYRYYQPAQPRYVPRAAPFAARGGYYANPLPYNRSPYTDDWSTGRHLPFPKPWMLPTRDPAHRGR